MRPAPPVVFIDDTGIVTQRATYDAYGNRVVGNIGDLNLDGFTDDTDFVLFSAAYNNFTDVTGDLNFDGVTDDADFVLFSAAYNALTPAQPDPRLAYAGYLSVRLGQPGDPFYLQLYLARNRWYDPGAGRWIQRDPAGYVDGLHLYLYVRSNPLAFIDPLGLWPSWDETKAFVKTFASESISGVGAAFSKVNTTTEQLALQVVDAGGLAVDTVGNATGTFNLNYKPMSDNGQRAAADAPGKSWTEITTDAANDFVRSSINFSSAGTSENLVSTYHYLQTCDSEALFNELRDNSAEALALRAVIGSGRGTRSAPAPGVTPASAGKPVPPTTAEAVSARPADTAGPAERVSSTAAEPRTPKQRVHKVESRPDAVGEYTGFKTNEKGDITGYTQYNAEGKPVKRFRGQGSSHGGVPPPFVVEPKRGQGSSSPLSRARPARPDEIPRRSQ